MKRFLLILMLAAGMLGFTSPVWADAISIHGVSVGSVSGKESTRILHVDEDGTVYYRAYGNKKIYYGAVRNQKKLWEFANNEGIPLHAEEFSGDRVYFYGIRDQKLKVIIYDKTGKRYEAVAPGTYNLTEYYGDQVLADGTYYLRAMQGSAEVLLAFDAKAKFLWKRDFSSVVSTIQQDNSLYVLDKKYGLFKLRTDGKAKWKTPLKASSDSWISLEKDVLYIHDSGYEPGRAMLSAYSTDGAFLWMKPVAKLMDTFMIAHGNAYHYVDVEGSWNSYDAKGELLWSVSIPEFDSSFDPDDMHFGLILILNDGSLLLQDWSQNDYGYVMDLKSGTLSKYMYSTARSGTTYTTENYMIYYEEEEDAIVYADLEGNPLHRYHYAYKPDFTEDETTYFYNETTFYTVWNSKIYKIVVPLPASS
ncbi:PQQ-binding-like beta-propeller repeat protein [Paenibacillus methanolicus]|uniref:Putative pyrroloquinoline-quinone binding quinoprotein n=1 Tax=Paenibacillus methanolicus TaxID=582686 RepID=A0A5S5CI74_9BACL|nr:PQQ-binding-like beta-propeller repeat protein [Paenibacillus methanolicus]TYP79422.1 putative pyrroloquinoline-quinone binding quinoprotein [Paenibacillus methanolicus]